MLKYIHMAILSILAINHLSCMDSYDPNYDADTEDFDITCNYVLDRESENYSQIPFKQAFDLQSNPEVKNPDNIKNAFIKQISSIKLAKKQ